MWVKLSDHIRSSKSLFYWQLGLEASLLGGKQFTLD